MATILRADLIDKNLAVQTPGIDVRAQFLTLIEGAKQNYPRSVTPGRAKDLPETFDLIRRAIQDYERREETAEKYKVVITEEYPDFTLDLETITFSVISSIPGAYSEGAPLESKVRALKPMLREVQDDPDNPGYKLAVFGYCLDSIVRITAWSRTNKQANHRVDWLQKIMLEYDWYFRSQGVGRLIFLRRNADTVLEHNSSKLYGRPLEFFVRTETITVVQEKTLERLSIDSGLPNNGSTIDVDLL